jgi:hypothetical protein
MAGFWGRDPERVSERAQRWVRMLGVGARAWAGRSPRVHGAEEHQLHGQFRQALILGQDWRARPCVTSNMTCTSLLGPRSFGIMVGCCLQAFIHMTRAHTHTLHTPGNICTGAGGDNGTGKYENVGKSQSVLIMINPIIFTRTRTKSSSEYWSSESST